MTVEKSKRTKHMSKSEGPEIGRALPHYERLIATNAKVERKGAGMPYTSVNGHMFSFLTKTGKLALRLPAEQREAFLRKHKSRLCEQNGTVLKEMLRCQTLCSRTRRG